VRNPKLTANSYIHGKRKLCGQARWETRKFNCVLYAATEKPKDMHRAFVFVFKTCCFSVHVKGIYEEFSCREPNLNMKLVIAAPAASDLRLCGKLLHYAFWLDGHRIVGSWRTQPPQESNWMESSWTQLTIVIHFIDFNKGAWTNSHLYTHRKLTDVCIFIYE
jgi:hypothetical protein